MLTELASKAGEKYWLYKSLYLSMVTTIVFRFYDSNLAATSTCSFEINL